LSSLSTPAADEGISIEALSLSTVMSDCSSLIVSPGLTSTSMTETSLKSPMSGTLMSMRGMSGSLQQHAAEIRQHLAEVGVEARRRRAVDDAVVVRQRQRQHQARLELLAVPHGLHLALRQAQDGDFGRV